MLTLEQILESIYGGGMKPADYAEMLLKIQLALHDSFYEDPPSKEQEQILWDLANTADKVRGFYK
jgi:hypothetical protein